MTNMQWFALAIVSVIISVLCFFLAKLIQISLTKRRQAELKVEDDFRVEIEEMGAELARLSGTNATPADFVELQRRIDDYVERRRRYIEGEDSSNEQS